MGAAVGVGGIGGVLLVGPSGDLVANLPQVFVEEVLMALVQDFDRGAHGADDAASDDALGEFEVAEAEELNAFVEINQAFGEVVESEEFSMATVHVVERDSGGSQLLLEGMAKAGANMQQSEKAGRVQATAVTEAGADDLVVVGGDGFQHG